MVLEFILLKGIKTATQLRINNLFIKKNGYRSISSMSFRVSWLVLMSYNDWYNDSLNNNMDKKKSNIPK